MVISSMASNEANPVLLAGSPTTDSVATVGTATSDGMDKLTAPVASPSFRTSAATSSPSMVTKRERVLTAVAMLLEPAPVVTEWYVSLGPSCVEIVTSNFPESGKFSSF